MRPVHLWLALAAIACILLFSKPSTPWEFDEILFYEGLHHYDPVAHHPPPPGYPLFIRVAQLVRALVPTDLAALVTISIIGSLTAFVLLVLAFGAIAGDSAAGLAGALFFYLSPSMLVNAALPMSEPGAIALLAAGIYLLAVRRSPIAGAAFLAASVGWRPQFAIFVLPLLVGSLFLMRRWRERAGALAAFALVCIAWLLILIAAVGGVHALVSFETSQAAYLAAHDAGESRSGWTAPQLAARFIAHPWGMKLLAAPVLCLAAFGLVTAIRRRRVEALPLVAAGVVYIAFALANMDPADGVRYAIPFTLTVALFAGLGAAAAGRAIGVTPYTLPILFGAGAMAYVGPMISQRAWSASPPVRAASFARATLPGGAVALYELPLWPQASYLLPTFHPMRIDSGLAQFFDRPDVPLFIYADGASKAPGARVFRWQPSDAYSKLTRNHYRVTSIIPLPPERRFKPLRGVYQTEREIEGDEWRWLAQNAALEVPALAAAQLTVVLGLPRTSILERNLVTISIDGRAVRQIAAVRDQRVSVTVQLPRGARTVSFDSAASVVPAEHPATLNRDVRRLAVKMYDFSLRRGAEAAAPRGVSPR